MSLDMQAELLRQFVDTCQKNPSLLHQPRFSFYKEYLESLGATIPPAPEEEATKKGTPQTEFKPEPEVEEEDESMDDLPEIDLDMTGVIKGEEDEPLSMGDINKKASEEDVEKANELRSAAMAAFSDGEYAKALENFTEAITLNPGSAILHAKRANVLLKMNKPNAAIRDCTEAIKLNPDSATGYKFRGRAHRLLGNFLDAHRDLATACKLDYDETANEWLKEVEPNAKKLLEHNRAKERKKEEKNLNARKERIRRAQEENRRAAEKQKEEEESHEFDEGYGQAAGDEGMPAGFADILKDPEILSLMNDPTAMAAFADIMKDPANMAKYKDNPKIVKLFEKLMASSGGAPPNMPSKPDEPPKPDASGFMPPPKVPEPDLD